MSVSFSQLLAQAKLEMDANGDYLAKPYRNCSSVRALFTAIRAMIDSHNAEVAKLQAMLTQYANEKSKLAAEKAELGDKLRKSQMRTVERGLEGTDLPEATRDRLLTVE